MLDIIGNIKINEQNNIRVKMFEASLRSLEFLKNIGSKVFLNLEDASYQLIHKAKEILYDIGLQGDVISISCKPDRYGKIYKNLLNLSQAEWVMNFEEDHFCVMENWDILKEILIIGNQKDVNVIRASFWPIEWKSMMNTKSLDVIDGPLLINKMTKENFAKFQEPYISRYFLGNNSIWHKYFAYQYYDRPGFRPHSFEISEYNENYYHILGVPSEFPILCSIDDSHGETNSHLLANPTEKFTKIWNSI